MLDSHILGHAGTRNLGPSDTRALGPRTPGHLDFPDTPTSARGAAFFHQCDIRSLFLLEPRGFVSLASASILLVSMLRYRSTGSANRQGRGRARGRDRGGSPDSQTDRRGAKGNAFQRNRQNVSSGPRRISAVPPRQLKARDWLRAYADHKGECVETFGKGATALSPKDMKTYLNANNSEFKRRMGFALSFLCATFRSAWTVVKHLPDGLLDLASSRKRRGCLLRALADLRTMLTTKKGKKFLRACDFLDSKHVCSRNKKDAEMHVRAWLDWIEDTKGLTRVLMTLANCSSRLFLCATWGLEAQACVGDLAAWAVGFPSDKDVVAALPRAVRVWLRKPTSKRLLIRALSESVKEHVIEAGSKMRDWADYDDDAGGKADGDSGSEDGSASGAGDDGSSASAADPSSPAHSARDAASGDSSSSSASSADRSSDDASDAPPASSSSRRKSKKRKQKVRTKVSFAAAKKKLKKASADRKLGKHAKARPAAKEAPAPATPRADSVAEKDRRSKSRPSPHRHYVAPPADAEDAASDATQPMPESGSDVDDEASVLPPITPSPVPKARSSRAAQHVAHPGAAAPFAPSRASSCKRRAAAEAATLGAPQAKASRSRGANVSGASAALVIDEQSSRRSALSARARSEPRQPPPADAAALHAEAPITHVRTRRTSSPAAPDIPRPLAPKIAAGAPSDRREIRDDVLGTSSTAAATACAARSRSRPRSRSRHPSQARNPAPPPQPGSPVASESDPDEVATAVDRPARDPDEAIAAGAHRQRKPLSASPARISASAPAPQARRGSRAGKNPQPETVDAIKKLLTSRSQSLPAAAPASTSLQQPAVLLDSDDDRPPDVPADAPRVDEPPAWAPLEPPPEDTLGEDAQLPRSAPCSPQRQWALPAVLDAKALHDRAEEKIASDSLAIHDFETLIQAIPADLRAGAGIGVKASNRTRLPRNVAMITGRIADIIHDALAAHGVGASSSSLPPPQPCPTSLPRSQSPPPGQPDADDTLLD